MKIAKTLILISAWFIFCESFKFFGDSYLIKELIHEIFVSSNTTKDHKILPVWISCMKDIAILMIALNSSTNFVIYFWGRQEFRTIWKRIYCFRTDSGTFRLRNLSMPTATTSNGQRNSNKWRHRWKRLYSND